MVGIGSIVMVLSLFFPWYQDLDSFRTGDTFTGLTGPMYLTGFTFLVIASLSLLFMVMDYLDRKVPLFKIKTSKLHLWSGIFAFYNLFLVGSVYFHPAFGVNITLKQSGFGMFMAYAAAALMTAGGYLEGRGKAAVKEFEKETREPASQGQQGGPAKTVVEAKVVHPMIERKPREIHRTAAPQKTPSVQPTMGLEMEQDVQPEPVAPAAARPVQPANQLSDNERPAQPFRMDL